MDGLRPWFLIMVHVTPHKPSPVLRSLTVSIIFLALCITHSQMDQMSKSLRVCSTKPRRMAKIVTTVWWSTTIPPLTGSLQSLMQILQGRNASSVLPMSIARKQLVIQPEIILISIQHYLPMISIWVIMWCLKIPQASIGTQL